MLYSLIPLISKLYWFKMLKQFCNSLIKPKVVHGALSFYLSLIQFVKMCRIFAYVFLRERREKSFLSFCNNLFAFVIHILLLDSYKILGNFTSLYLMSFIILFCNILVELLFQCFSGFINCSSFSVAWKNVCIL